MFASNVGSWVMESSASSSTLLFVGMNILYNKKLHAPRLGVFRASLAPFTLPLVLIVVNVVIVLIILVVPGPLIVIHGRDCTLWITMWKVCTSMVYNASQVVEDYRCGDSKRSSDWSLADGGIRG
jgi:hypothetical protein